MATGLAFYNAKNPESQIVEDEESAYSSNIYSSEMNENNDLVLIDFERTYT